MAIRKTQTIHVAAGQIVSTPGDIAGNLAQVADLSRTAARAGARLILFGEGALTGYLLTPEILPLALTADGPAARELLAIARKNGIVIVAGTLERAGQRLHMSAFVAYPDGRLLVQRKHRLTPTELNAGLTPGPEKRRVFSVDGVKFAICICADSGIEDIQNKLVDWGAQVSLNPTAGGGGRKFMKHAADLEDPKKLKSYLRDMEKVCFLGGAIEVCLKHHLCMIACNLSGDDGVSNYHPGHAAIVDSGGKTVGLIPGEYVVEYLRPQLIHGEMVVRKPRRVEG
jgi:predicted amidohydrolase